MPRVPPPGSSRQFEIHEKDEREREREKEGRRLEIQNTASPPISMSFELALGYEARGGAVRPCLLSFFHMKDESFHFISSLARS